MDKPAVLFICLGNICRSPTAEAVFSKRAFESELDVTVESAGTSGWHIGERPDPRAIEAGSAAGYSFDGQFCRKVERADFVQFDYVLAMDMQNIKALKSLCPEAYLSKIGLFLDYAPQSSIREVPDPYYGGDEGFSRVLSLIEKASDGLIAVIKSAQKDEI